MSGIEAILVQNQLRWSGHVCRMEDSRIPKQLLYGESCDGRRSVGGQRKRYKDVLHHNLLAAGIKDSTWETIGQDRESWRTSVRNGVRHFEDNRIEHAKKKRALRKLRDGQQLLEGTDTSTLTKDLRLCACGRQFLNLARLRSHQRAHEQRGESYS